MGNGRYSLVLVPLIGILASSCAGRYTRTQFEVPAKLPLLQVIVDLDSTFEWQEHQEKSLEEMLDGFKCPCQGGASCTAYAGSSPRSGTLSLSAAPQNCSQPRRGWATPKIIAADRRVSRRRPPTHAGAPVGRRRRLNATAARSEPVSGRLRHSEASGCARSDIVRSGSQPMAGLAAQRARSELRRANAGALPAGCLFWIRR